MKPLRSILVLIPSAPTQSRLEQVVQNAMNIGRWLKSELHFLSAPGEAKAVEMVVSKFRRSHPNGPSTLVIHLSTIEPVGILETIHKYSCDLVLMQDSTVFYQDGDSNVGELMEKSPIPILLLPQNFDFLSNPPRSFLVPLSGEKRMSEALDLSMRLSEQSGFPVDLLHVITPGQPCTCDEIFEARGDQLHHEYREVIEKVASEASPYSTPEQRARIRHFHHSEGFTANEILRVLKGSLGAILVSEWRGILGEGHAQTLKSILEKTTSPVLFIKIRPEQKSRLRVGEYLKTESR